MDTMRTITEAATELNVSRKKIYTEIEKLNINTTKEGKNNYISDSDFLNIKNRLGVHMDTVRNVSKERLENVLERDRYTIKENISDREYTDLKERITSLEEQIRIKDMQLQDQLQAKDQQIQAKDIQINGLIQSNFNLTKTLTQPKDEIAVTEIKEVKKSFWGKFFNK